MVARGSVGRPAVGEVRKDVSASALRAYIASRLEGRSDASYLRDDLGVALSTTAVRRAARGRHWRPPGYKAPGRRQASTAGGQSPPTGSPLRNWLAVDPAGLELGAAVVTVTTDDHRAQREVYRALGGLVGVVHVASVSGGDDRRVLAFVLVDGEADRRRLRAQLDEIADRWRWDDVDDETVEPAIRTWRHLTQAAARRDGLLVPPAGTATG